MAYALQHTPALAAVLAANDVPNFNRGVDEPRISWRHRDAAHVSGTPRVAPDAGIGQLPHPLQLAPVLAGILRHEHGGRVGADVEAIRVGRVDGTGDDVQDRQVAADVGPVLSAVSAVEHSAR